MLEKRSEKRLFLPDKSNQTFPWISLPSDFICCRDLPRGGLFRSMPAVRWRSGGFDLRRPGHDRGNWSAIPSGRGSFP